MLDLFSLLIPDAMAQVSGDPAIGGGPGLRSFVPLIIIFGVFYFLIIRPQQKKIKQHETMVKTLKRGDKVVSGGGIIGTITKVDEDAGILEVDISNGVIIKVVRSMVSDVQVRSVPVEEKGKEPDKNDKKALKKEKK
jgi:preprotein translocase subunit YajC